MGVRARRAGVGVRMRKKTSPDTPPEAPAVVVARHAACTSGPASCLFTTGRVASALLDFSVMPAAIPDRPGLEGLEARWSARWEDERVYRFDRSRPREAVYSIDTPPLTVSGSLHVGHVFSF